MRLPAPRPLLSDRFGPNDPVRAIVRAMSSGRWRAGLAALVSIAAAFAARGEATSPFLSPARGEALAPGSIVEVRWASACASAPEGRADEAEVVLSLDGGLTFPIRVSNELHPC